MPSFDGVPDGFFWGIDSVEEITKPFFDSVVKFAGRAPDFWGRYITRFTLKASEVDFLRKNSPQTRLLLIHNDKGLGFFHKRKFNGAKVVGFTAEPDLERARGKKAALGARASAQAVEKDTGLTIPGNVWIYVNVESDSEAPPRIGKVSPDWVRGWWEGMRESKFQFGGIYGNVSDFFQSAEQAGQGRAAFSGAAYKEARAVAPQPLLPPVWSQNPHNKGRVGPNNITFGFTPGEPPGIAGVARIWQYHAQPTGFDIDLASQEAFDRMWQVGDVDVGPGE